MCLLCYLSALKLVWTGVSGVFLLGNHSQMNPLEKVASPQHVRLQVTFSEIKYFLRSGIHLHQLSQAPHSL